jgi:predicted transcriptional regulator
LIRGERADELSTAQPAGTPRYRTKVEVLRDILETTAPEASKSRILRLANLNPISFDHYLAFCIGTGLLERAGRKFRRTGSGDAAIEAIEGLMKKAEELGVAVRRLGATLGSEELPAVESTAALRFASLNAWDELVRHGARSGAYRPSRATPRRAAKTVRSTAEPGLLSLPGVARAGGVAASPPSIRGKHVWPDLDSLR